MAVILTVLKGIGILLLSVLGIVLALILVVLFVPVCYQAKGAYHDSLKAEAHVSWLFRLLSVRASFDEVLTVTVRGAGILLFPRPEKKKKKKAGEKTDGSSKETSTVVIPEETPPAIPEKKAAETQKGFPEEEEAAGFSETGTEEKETCHKASHSNPVKRLWEKLQKAWENIKKKCRDFCQKAGKAEETFSYYKNLFQREDTKRACRLVLSQLSGMLRHILPRKTDVELVIGTGDPASMGQLLAVGGILYPWLQNRVRIVPDFEEKHLEGDFFIKGHITACMLLICALRVVVNKEVRQLLKRLRKKEEA